MLLVLQSVRYEAKHQTWEKALMASLPLPLQELLQLAKGVTMEGLQSDWLHSAIKGWLKPLEQACEKQNEGK